MHVVSVARAFPRLTTGLVAILVGFLWASADPALAASPRIYTVKKGDSLYGVARSHGTSVAELARVNGLKPTSWLTPGQKLTLPRTAAANERPVAEERPLPASVQKAIRSAPVKSGRWRNIVIHHSATTEGSAQAIDRDHRRVRHMENGLAYHFVIGNGRGMQDGEIYVGNRWKKQLNGGHLASESQNTYCLGICLIGHFDRQQPTARQLASLRALIEELERRCNLAPSAVKTHRQVNVLPTRCPGERFPTDAFLRSLRDSASR